MDHTGDGEIPGAEHQKLTADGGGGEDRLSALPDDILVQILLRLDYSGRTSAAARTSVLSRRWPHLWFLLPEFSFGPEAGGHIVRAALSAHEAPSLRCLAVRADSSPGSIAEWLPVAAHRLSGELILFARRAENPGFLELPCFGSATMLHLHLEFHALALTPSGVFARLTDLTFRCIRFHGPCKLDDAISSLRFPSLKMLAIECSQGLSNFVIHSASLLKLKLDCLKGLQLLNVVAPALEALIVIRSFFGRSAQSQPVANISAPKLETLRWCDAFDPSTVHFCKMANLQLLRPYHFFVYGPENNQDCLRLLQRFQFDAIHTLRFVLAYGTDIFDREYLMEDMTVLPDIMVLELTVIANGHCIGPSLFHVLRICTGVRRLNLDLHNNNKLELEANVACVCVLPPNWTFEELVLNFLHEVEITNLSGTEHEMAFVKRFFSWAAALKEMTIVFHLSISESTAKVLCKKLLSFSRPGISMKFYLSRKVLDRVLYVPEE
uniref:F-box/LRR-repeat protein 15/At3g58940/PEG3-like LRR domain-containing protein n=1 Tax=Leersia perrieri TaxID=77586 RepID=A0A0D9WVD5_9ORYZ